MSECLFCAIAAGGASAAVVLDDEAFVAFLDHRPVQKGHVLLVPRQHVVTLPDLPASLRATASSNGHSAWRAPSSTASEPKAASWRSTTS